MLEKELEKYLIKRVKDCNLKILKLNPLFNKGIPDRLIYSEKGDINHQFVELKRDDKAKIGPLQLHLAKGLNTLFVSSIDEVEYLLAIYFTKYYKKLKK